MAKDTAEATGDDAPKAKSNLVPALVLAAGLILGGRFAAGGASSAPAAGAATTAAPSGAASSEPGTTEQGGDGEQEHGSQEHGSQEHDSQEHDSPEHASPDHDSPEHDRGDAPDPAWSYSGDTGPARWGALDEAWASCAEGTLQSPIDLDAPLEVDLADVRFEYGAVDATVEDTGHTVLATLAEGSSMRLDGRVHALVQLHVHAPSEHTVGRRSFPMEVHLVHRDDHGRLAVVGLFVEQGAQNPVLGAVLDALPLDGSARRAPTRAPLAVGSLLPTDRRTWRYRGSLTTPPCTEGVTWVLLRSPIQLSRAQIEAFTARHPMNARPTQPVNGRPVVADVA